jgi:hypothetical protein
MAKNGRSGQRERFVALPHYIMETVAWGQLSVTARAAWLEFVRIHNGSNNGRLAMSSRVLGERLGVCKTAAAEAIKELVTFGFLEIARSSSFSGKRRATEYRLTHLKNDLTGELASRAFQNVGKTAADKSNGLARKNQSSQSIPLSAYADNIGRLDGQGLSAYADTGASSCPPTRTVSQSSSSSIVRPRGHI